MPGITVIIPVKNGAETLKKSLDGWFAQTYAGQLEVLVIDSGSQDDTLEIIGEYPIRLIRIEPEEFNHGATRNLGISEAASEIVLMTVQDAWTRDKLLLERMASHFDDPEVMGVCGQQIVPHDPDKNPVAWFRSFSEPVPRRYQFPPGEYQDLAPREKAFVGGWDDVIAMYRRSHLLNHPFDHTNFSEDLKWANKALLEGQALVFDYRNRVCHYHHEDFTYRYRRQFIEDCQRLWTFGLKPAPLKRKFSSIRKLVSVFMKERFGISWWGYNLKIILAEFLAGVGVQCLHFMGSQWLMKHYQSVTNEVPQGKQYVSK